MKSCDVFNVASNMAFILRNKYFTATLLIKDKSTLSINQCNQQQSLNNIEVLKLFLTSIFTLNKMLFNFLGGCFYHHI